MNKAAKRGLIEGQNKTLHRTYTNPETGQKMDAACGADLPEHVRLTSKVIRNKKKNRAKRKAQKKNKRR